MRPISSLRGSLPEQHYPHFWAIDSPPTFSQRTFDGAKRSRFFTFTLRDLTHEIDASEAAPDHLLDFAGFDDWATRWRERLARERVSTRSTWCAITASKLPSLLPPRKAIRFFPELAHRPAPAVRRAARDGGIRAATRPPRARGCRHSEVLTIATADAGSEWVGFGTAACSR